MAVQDAATREYTCTLIKEHAVIGWRYNVPVKIDQVGIVGAVSLGITNAVGIVTGIARGPFIPDMFVMFTERFIIQNTGPAVTSIAKFIGRSRFKGIICGLILVFKLCRIDGAMWPKW